MVPTERELHESTEMRAFTSRIYRTMLAGINEEKKRDWLSWRSRPINEHMRHASVHMLNVMHHENMERRDSEGGNEFDHAITRMFFCATIHDSKVKEAMRGMQEEIAE